MPELFLTIFFISILLFFLGTGVWVAISMIGVSAIGMIIFTSRPVGDAMATTIWGTSSSWTLTALPLFVWMGEILFRTKLSENLFKGLSPWMSRLPGGLIHVNVVGCALFAAISGSSAATVATVGKMSIPELRKRKYPEKLILGSLAGSGTLGLLIPPSIILIMPLCIFGQNWAGTWRVSPEAGALHVGPPDGSTWWANSLDDVTTRACYFDDEYVFNARWFVQ